MLLSIVLATAMAPLSEPLAQPQRKMNVLVFTKTGGFRHDSIPNAIAMFKELGDANGFTVEATEDSTIFAKDKLAKFDVVAFANTTGDILNDEQQAAFQEFMSKGKGFVGLHAASDTEYGWPWFGELVGAYFRSHPPGTYEADIHMEQHGHETVKMLPKVWRRRDEWYDFKENPRKNVRVLATLSEASFNHKGMGDDHPIIWCRELPGGSRSWYTALGHTKETYSEPLFRESVLAAIKWTAKRK